jgi:peptide/nickel transport system substrate-binding protein
MFIGRGTTTSNDANSAQSHAERSMQVGFPISFSETELVLRMRALVRRIPDRCSESGEAELTRPQPGAGPLGRFTLRPLPGWIAVVVGILGLLLSGCATPPDILLPTVGPTPTRPAVTPATLPPPPKTLIVCLRNEPTSLYLYSPDYASGQVGGEIDTIFQALYDGPLDIRGYEYRPVILEKTPSLTDGDARVQTVQVDEGEVYFNPETLQPDSLESGKMYLPAGCRDLSCAETYSSGEVDMDQLEADFRLVEGIRWSDGDPLTSADSVFSYKIESDPNTPGTKFLLNYTQSYVSVDDRTSRWTGIPGFMDNEYRGDFWWPLPEHVLGDRTAAQLLEDPAANRQLIGWGPYMIDTWEAGKDLRLKPNPYYFRSPDGLPAFDYLEFRFLGQDSDSAVERLTTGECDIVDESLLDLSQIGSLKSLAEQRRLQFEWSAGSVEERLEFNLAPPKGTTLVGDVATRRALAACIDRQTIVDDVLGGAGEVATSYIPVGDPLFQEASSAVAYDPAAGQLGLQSAGWISPGGDSASVRVARGVAGVPDGTKLALSLVTSNAELEQAIADKIKQDLSSCGVEITVEALDPATLLAEWPDGPVFGRTFDLALWAWPTVVSPVCEMFSSSQIPSDANPHGINASGFSDPDYDAACDSILLNTPDTAGFVDGVQTTQEIFADQVPALPLVLRPRLIADSNAVCGVEPDPSTSSLLWNLESIRPEGECQAGS